MLRGDLVGRTHKFEDGDSITVIQIKIRDENIPFVTYHVQQGPGIPRKLVLPLPQFLEHYGQLFGISDDNTDLED